jgi:hypothetical protein
MFSIVFLFQTFVDRNIDRDNSEVECSFSIEFRLAIDPRMNVDIVSWSHFSKGSLNELNRKVLSEFVLSANSSLTLISFE